MPRRKRKSNEKEKYLEIMEKIYEILRSEGALDALKRDYLSYRALRYKKKFCPKFLRERFNSYMSLQMLERKAERIASNLGVKFSKYTIDHSSASATEVSPTSVIDANENMNKIPVNCVNVTPNKLMYDQTGTDKHTLSTSAVSSETPFCVFINENVSTEIEVEEASIDSNDDEHEDIEAEEPSVDHSDDEHEDEQDIFCSNCKRHRNVIDNLLPIYHINFIRRKSSDIRQRKKFRNVKRSTKKIEEFYLCGECDAYLCHPSESGTNDSKIAWPAFVWEVLKNKEVRNRYDHYVWRFLPHEWRGWWINSVGEFEEFEDVSLESPTCFFEDKTKDVLDWKTKIGTNKLIDLMDACNRHMIPNILCPYGCSEFCFRTGTMDFDCVWQRFLPQCIIVLINNVNKMKFVRSVRDDFVRNKGDYDVWLYNPEWGVKPSIVLTSEAGPVIMSCRNHNGGTSSHFIHTARLPGHILPSRHSDQYSHAVIKPRTIAPLKAKKYSNSFQMHEQRGTFNGIDTCSITSTHNFALNSLLLRESEFRAVKNRPDINALLSILCEEKKLPASFVDNVRKMTEQETRHIDFEYLQLGATYVPVSAAMAIQDAANAKPIRVIWDAEPDYIGPESVHFCKKSFASVLFPIQKCNSYGVAFPTIPTYKCRETSSLALWVMSGLMGHVELIWQNVSKVSLRQSQWHGWMLMYLTKKLFTHIKTRPDKGDPFRMEFVRNIEAMVNKCHSCYDNGSFQEAFTETPGILFCKNYCEMQDGFDTRYHDVIIIEQNNTNFADMQLDLIMDNAEFELRCAVSYERTSETNYFAEIFSRHGGDHYNWFYQQRDDPYSREWEGEPRFCNGHSRLFVYCKKILQKVDDINKEIMRYIGGQTHVVCGTHKLPLITMFDRKKKCCMCKRKEHFGCPNLQCKVCICKRCANGFDINDIHFINASDNNLSDLAESDSDSDSDSESGEREEDIDTEDEENLFDLDFEAPLERDDLDEYMINGGGGFGGEDDMSNDGSLIGVTNEDDEFYIPTTDAGELAVEIEETGKRGTNVSSHVLLNQCGSILTRKRNVLNGSSLQKFFIERIVAQNIGKSVPLLYPEGMLFPSIFYSMSNNAVVGSIPSSLMSDLVTSFGFSPLNDHLRARLTSSSNQTSTNPRYISWCYDIMTNAAVTHSDTRIALNRGLCYDDKELDGLSVRGKNDSALLESIDSNQMVRNLTAAQKYYLMDYFVTFTCNQKKHFGTKNIKNWLDDREWMKYIPDFYDMTEQEQREYKNAITQSSAGLLLRAWNETCRFFLEYLRTSSSSPFKKVMCMFARHEYQKDVGNLPHIHAMIKIDPNTFTENEQYFTEELIRADVLAIVRPTEVEKLKEQGLVRDFDEMRDVIDDGSTVLPHTCSERCLRAVGNGKYVCRHVKVLSKNQPPNNVRSYMEDLPNGLTPECLKILEEIDLIEPLVVHENGYVEPFKSKHDYFDPKRCYPPVSWTHDLNISPVISELFCSCRSMQNVQQITRCGGCNKYCVKYMSKIDEQNYVIVSAKANKNGVIQTRKEFVANSKITSSKIHEDEARDLKRDSKRVRGRAISLNEMLHHMLRYSEVKTDLCFVSVPTNALEIRPRVHLKKPIQSIDGAEVGVLVDNVRRRKNLPDWRQLTRSEKLVAQDRRTSIEKIDAVTQFSLRPPELRKIFNRVGDYFRWFKVDHRILKNNDVREMITDDYLTTCWVDSIGCKVMVRKKAINEIVEYLNELDFTDTNSSEYQTKNMFYAIRTYIEEGDDCDLDDDFKKHLVDDIIFNDDDMEHLPIPVYSFIQPTVGVQFILHLMLSLGRFSTELDLTNHTTLREALRYAQLIGPNDDEESLKKYAGELLHLFIVEQLVYFPNSRQMIDSWIVIAHELLLDVIIKNEIPIVDIPPVQLTALYASKEEADILYMKETRKEIISAAMNELAKSSESCSIPDSEALEKVTREEPLDWDASECYVQSEGQPDESFKEQQLAIEVCQEAIDRYCDPTNIHFIKNITIRGFAGCGKSWLMQYMATYAMSKGLNCLTTALMARRSNFLGGKHIHHVFCLPVEKGLTAHRMAELAVCNLLRESNSTKLNFLRTLDVLFYDEIGQLSAEMLSVLDLILRTIRGSNTFFGGVLTISTMDHLQLQPVVGRPFLLSSHVLTCFKMVQLKTSVRAANDKDLQRILEIACMHPCKYIENSRLLVEFQDLLDKTCTFVENWEDPEITPLTFRLYGMRVPANDATKEFVENVRRTIDPDKLRVKNARDMEKSRYSHCDWQQAQPKTIETLDKRVKEPSVLTIYEGAIFEFTCNSNDFTQSQICIVITLPSAEDIANGKKFVVWVGRPGQREIVYDRSWTPEDMVRMGYKKAYAFLVPQRIIYCGRYVQCYRIQYCVKPRYTSTIHAAMGETLNRVAMQVNLNTRDFKLWDKAQVIVALSRTKLGKNIIFVGDKSATLKGLTDLIKRTSQWTDYMEEILDLVTINVSDDRPRYLTQKSYPFRIMDQALPMSKTGYVYFILSTKFFDYTYIGMTKSIRRRLREHNTGYRSTQSTPIHLRPYALVAYICGFDGDRGLMRHLESKWQLKREELCANGINDWKEWVRSGIEVIDEFDSDCFNCKKEELRLVCLFRD